MSRHKVRVKVRTGKVREQRRSIFQPRRFFRRWNYLLLMGAACIATVVMVWFIIGRIKPILPSE